MTDEDTLKADAFRRVMLRLWGGAFCVGLVLGAGCAMAFGGNRMTMLDGDEACFAYVSIHNRAGFYNETEKLATEHGEVAISYTTHGGHNATDHDEIEVVSLPIGVFARPMRAQVPDGETFRVCLFEFVGG